MPKITSNYLGTRSIEKLLTNEYYKGYWEQKQEIKQKYPPILKMSNEEWKVYLHEISELIHEPNGYFQQFVWDTMAEQDKIIQERTARGKQRKRDLY